MLPNQYGKLTLEESTTVGERKLEESIFILLKLLLFLSFLLWLMFICIFYYSCCYYYFFKVVIMLIERLKTIIESLVFFSLLDHGGVK